MNTNYKEHLAYVCLIALGLVFAPAITRPAQAGASYPVSIQIALASSPAISLGEPVMLRYRITNTSEQKIAERLGSRLDEWYTLSLTSNNSKGATRLSKPMPSEMPGLHLEPTGDLRPGGTSEGYIVATQSLIVLYPGKYTLHVHVHLPIAAVGALGEGANEAFVSAHGQTWAQEFSFPLTITPADRSRLKTTAEALRKDIAHEKNVVRREADAEALFSMPEAEALPSWQALASGGDSPTGSRLIAIKQLALKRSVGTADALAEFVWSEVPSSDETVQLEARSGLARMYEIGDATLQRHIQEIYASHGEKVLGYSLQSDN